MATMSFHYGADHQTMNVLNQFHHICTLVFLLSIIIEISGYGYQRFYDNDWRKF